MAFRVNEVLTEYFRTLGVRLVDFKLEFGRLADGTLVLADEISPTPAASGISRRTRSSTRTASAATWAVWRMPTAR